jgi:hypothetical protein
MSKIALSPNASGTGTFSIASPGTNTDRTLTLPDASGTLATTADIPSVNPFTLGTAVASTSGTAIDFTGIPSWAKRVTVMLQGVSTNGTSHLLLQIGDAGGLEATGYVGAIGGAYASGVTGITSSTAGYELEVGSTTAAVTRHGNIVLTYIGSNVWACIGVVGITSINGSSTSGGSKTLSATLDRVRITTVNGTDTFDAGTINVSWEG